MRRNLFLLFLLFASCCYASSQAGTLTGYLTYTTFNTAGGKSYIETYLTIIGSTAKFVKDTDNIYQAEVHIAISFWKGNSEILANHYGVRSPQTTDTLQKPDFIDVERYGLKRGVYTLKLTLADAYNRLAAPLSISRTVSVGYNPDSLCISNAEFLQSYQPSAEQGPFDKCGYEMMPYEYNPAVANYYPKEINKIQFYAEIYNANRIDGEHAKFVLKYFIESADAHAALPNYNHISVQQADTINPVLGGFNIQKLHSGSYNLVIQAIDKNNKIKASRSYNFIRQSADTGTNSGSLAVADISHTFVNKITNKDTLIAYIQALSPIANLSEKDFTNSTSLKQTDITVLKQFFYNFWVSRNPSAPESEWQKYYAQVKLVNSEFGASNLKGYQTDRGRVYLEYGPPDQQVKSEMNPNSYPYEIWEYYHLKDGEVDRKFVFYDPSIVTNNYVLLTSNAKGEISNRQWQIILNSRLGEPNNVDQNTIPDNGENTLDEYNNPR